MHSRFFRQKLPAAQKIPAFSGKLFYNSFRRQHDSKSTPRFKVVDTQKRVDLKYNNTKTEKPRPAAKASELSQSPIVVNNFSDVIAIIKKINRQEKPLDRETLSDLANQVKALDYSKLTPIDCEQLLGFIGGGKCNDTIGVLSLSVVQGCASVPIEFTERMYVSLLGNLSKSVHMALSLGHYYATFRAKARTQRWRLSSQLYVDVARVLCGAEQGGAVGVLKDMQQLRIALVPSQLEPLLAAALIASDTQVLHMLTTWYVEVFPQEKLGHGVLRRLLTIAAARGHAALAKTAWQLVTESVYVPSVGDFQAYVAALCKGGEVYLMLSAVVDMKARHPDAFPDPYTRYSYYHTNKTLLVTGLLSRRRGPLRLGVMFDDLARRCIARQCIPPFAVDAFVEIFGHVKMLSRAQHALQIYSKRFAWPPSIGTYNSLLRAHVAAKSGLEAFFDIFPRIEEIARTDTSGTKHYELSESYSILLDYVVNWNNADIVREVLNQAAANGVILHCTTLKRIAEHFEESDPGLVQEVDALLSKQYRLSPIAAVKG